MLWNPPKPQARIPSEGLSAAPRASWVYMTWSQISEGQVEAFTEKCVQWDPRPVAVPALLMVFFGKRPFQTAEFKLCSFLLWRLGTEGGLKLAMEFEPKPIQRTCEFSLLPNRSLG